MMHHIDLSSVLRQTLACDLYSNLVTRPTGAAVRGQIEELLGSFSGAGERALTIIDFSQVSMIDFSCADEVVAKLLLRYARDDAPGDAYFLLRGVTEDHSDAIEAVLERHDLAAAVEAADGVRVMGKLPADEQRAWDAAYTVGDAGATAVAAEMRTDLDTASRALEALCRRRLVMRVGDRFIVVGRDLVDE
jgi:hypothetical protein